MQLRDQRCLDVHLETLALKAPFQIAGRTFTSAQVIVVVISDSHRLGRGEAAGVYYLNETPESMLAQIETQRGAIESGVSREDLQHVLPAGGARNAVDCAIWDLESHTTGIPAWRRANLPPPKPLLTTFTIGANTPKVMASEARQLKSARALKLKLTGEPLIDIQRVKAVRAARPDVWLGADANQSYNLDTIDMLLESLADSRLSLLEQPFARGCDADLDLIRCPIPVAADESVQTLADLDSLNGRFSVVNIKLDKCGGLTEALEMASRARLLGLEVMVGCMMGSTWAMAPAFLLGQLCDVVDIDAPFLLKADRIPSIVYCDGYAWCPSESWGGRDDDAI
jgi:L-Ala-D/L-Glu epimerase